MPTVTIVQQSVKRYREAFYLELRACLAAQGVRLRLIESGASSHDEARGDGLDLAWSEQAPSRVVVVRGRWMVWQRVLPAARSSDLVIVEQGSRLLVNYVLLVRQLLGRTRLAFWGHGRDFDDAPSRLGERVKAAVSRHVHWWFAYNRLAVDVVRGLGFPAERITDVRNATDTAGLRAAIERLGEVDRRQVRAELGIGDGPVGVTVGAMSDAKDLAFLFAAADRVAAAVPGFQLVLAGGGASREEAEAFAASRPWVSLRPPTFGDDLARLLAIADLVLVPAGVGLIVVDAFAAGVPLVASASASHRPEIAYLRSGHNGLLADDGGRASAYADVVVDLLRDPARRSRLGAGAAASVGDLSARVMAERFSEGVVAALAAPTRRSATKRGCRARRRRRASVRASSVAASRDEVVPRREDA